MQAIQIISISGGTPVIYLPLTVIILITAIKDLFEDLKRHKSDNEENNRRVSVFRNGSLMEICWKDLKVGETVKVHHLFFIDFEYNLYLVYLIFKTRFFFASINNKLILDTLG